MPLRPRPEIENLKAGTHGGINYAEMAALGIDPQNVLDFSVCTNPYMPPPGVKRALRSVSIDRYPDSATTELRQKLSARLSVSPENIIAGNGTTELIRLITLAYFSKGDNVLVAEPTYDDYDIASRIAGAGVVRYRAVPENGFVPDIAEITELIRQRHPKAVFICSPNNPTGRYLSRWDIERIVAALPEGLLVLDEAYLSFVDNSWTSAALAARGNIILLRSMTKDYGLAGLRLGYAVASADIIATLRRVCPPWNVNAVAQKIGLMVLEQDDYLQTTRRRIQKARQYLVNSLTRFGLPPLPTDANFFLVKVGDAAGLRQKLLLQGILVRDCASFGLPEYIRLAPRTLPECRRFVKTLENVLKKLEGIYG